jgi:hypothetical protein
LDIIGMMLQPPVLNVYPLRTLVDKMLGSQKHMRDPL